jgi:hypothetical protein
MMFFWVSVHRDRRGQIERTDYRHIVIQWKPVVEQLMDERR